MQEIVNFILELEKLKAITRKVRPLGLDRYENSAEHSWQLALFAISLARYADPPVDINRVIHILLVHDIGEIDAGDTLVFTESGWEQYKAAEVAAVKRIFGLLSEPERIAMLALWEEFERGETPEAHYAHAIDRAMPVLLNLANQGQSWRENGISYERVVNRVAAPIKRGCPFLWNYLEVRLKEARNKGFFGG